MNEEQTILPGFDDLVAETEGISPEEAARISAESRQAFEILDANEVSWADEYFALRAEGWPWRVACYIAWASTPRQGRWPETLAGLASVLGLKSTRSIRRWREKNPEIDARVATLVARPLLEARADVLEALVDVATTPEAKCHPDRKLFLEMTGLYTPRQTTDINVARAGIFLPEVDPLPGDVDEGADGDGA